MVKKLNTNLNDLMGEMKISAEELARRINIPASTIKKIRNEENANPTLATLQPLADFFNLTLGQLTGDEPLPLERQKGSYKTNKQIFKSVPVLSWQAAANYETHLATATNFISTEHPVSETAFALMVEEDNWENLLLGTTLIIDPMITADHRDLVIVCKKGQLPSVKLLLKEDDLFYLKPLVSGYQINQLTEEYSILGVIVEYKKSLKTAQLEVA